MEIGVEIREHYIHCTVFLFIWIQDIRKIIEEALATFAADHIGKFDYALEVSGGSIPRSHCSETYSPSSSTIRLFGLALWHYSNSPRTVIQVSKIVFNITIYDQ